MPESNHPLTESLRSEALRLGFCHVGVCDAVAAPGFERLRQWLEAGYAGQMHYLADRLEAYRHPNHVLGGARSLLVLATDYLNVDPERDAENHGRISRYAWGLDYHDVLWDRLNALADFHRRLAPEALVRGVVDTAPIMEREFAVLAGLGWIGKNTLLLTRDRGSWLFLSILLTTEELVPDAPFASDHCGTCRACIDACPTGALVDPYVLDARRCISYLTIELREPVPVELREPTDKWLFGCDVCQEVCPWNRRRAGQEANPECSPEFRPMEGQPSLDLLELFHWDDAAFRARFRKTPLWRAKRRGMLRNAAIVLGNQASPDAAEALLKGLADVEPLVREASAWALGRIGNDQALGALDAQREVEEDPTVCESIRRALG